LARLPLKTPYPAVIARIQYIMARLPRETDLIVDFGGVGRGIYDMIVDAGLNPIGVTELSRITASPVSPSNLIG
jgi:hypothetical protein